MVSREALKGLHVAAACGVGTNCWAWGSGRACVPLTPGCEVCLKTAQDRVFHASLVCFPRAWKKKNTRIGPASSCLPKPRAQKDAQHASFAKTYGTSESGKSDVPPNHVLLDAANKLRDHGFPSTIIRQRRDGCLICSSSLSTKAFDRPITESIEPSILVM